jgi:hypothetical protein
MGGGRTSDCLLLLRLLAMLMCGLLRAAWLPMPTVVHVALTVVLLFLLLAAAVRAC